MNKFSWTIKKNLKNSRARLGIIETPHGIIKTPAFIFCATKAALKTLSSQQVLENHTQIILSNTYHLMLQPGEEIIANHGGLHNFMSWKGPMLTDSGGFQVFSLGHGSVANEIKGRGKSLENKNKLLVRVDDEGATFKSYIDGKLHKLTPNKSIKIQQKAKYNTR